MLTSNINFLNFKSSKKIKGLSKKIKKFKNENFLLTTPLLKSFSQNYKYSYDRKIIKKLKNKKFFKIIGMGGSILGAKAIYFFLKKKIKKKFIFIDNLNPKVIKSVKAVNIIISKSGETLETISNFHALKIKKKDKNIFITENNNSYLLNLAKNIKADIIDHRNYIGGRYSVLSEVGMLPAELMGLKEKNFKKYNYLIKNNKFIHQLVYNVENTLSFIKKDKMNSVILNYDDCSESLFRWYQQLISESLGKKSKGLIPMISQMPTDNHSLLQLYLDGPKKNFFTFYSVINDKTDIVKQRNVNNKIQYIENKSLNNIISAQKQATQNVFLKKNIPFRSFEIKSRSESVLGELFCFFVLETILLGRALKVNPFDQPSVELIKKETKKLLS
tara:strand:+ start:1009 stop:2172 length:1164 start_codon:yes stop_codon:yes gene_type:complete